MAPLFTSPKSEHRRPLLRHNHGPAPAFRVGEWERQRSGWGLPRTVPLGTGRPCLPPSCPIAISVLHSVCRRAPAGQPGLYLATATKQAAASADWRQGAWCTVWFEHRFCTENREGERRVSPGEPTAAQVRGGGPKAGVRMPRMLLEGPRAAAAGDAPGVAGRGGEGFVLSGGAGCRREGGKVTSAWTRDMPARCPGRRGSRPAWNRPTPSEDFHCE